LASVPFRHTKYLFCGQLFCLNVALRVLKWLLIVGLSSAVATTDFNRMQNLAMQRYGDRGANTVAEWRQLINEVTPLDELQKLTKVNDFFNSRVAFVDDIINWQQNDYWATPLETMGIAKGDCEDFSIAKYTTLQLVGVPIEKLRMTYVKAKIGGRNSTISQAHMIVSYYPAPNAEPLLLDNLIPDIRPASRRNDLTPVFSFNSAGIWVGGATQAASNNPGARLSRWRDLIARMQNEGLQ
jgi:predicted transglutaminase-like cysteine proteinase